jgi:hypothetical protein
MRVLAMRLMSSLQDCQGRHRLLIFEGSAFIDCGLLAFDLAAQFFLAWQHQAVFAGE